MNPCSINYIINTADKVYVDEIILIYKINVWRCSSSGMGPNLTITIKNANQFVATDLKHEKYTLNVTKDIKNGWQLSADYYVGFLRGFETFSQLLVPTGAPGLYDIKNVPIYIQDQPQYLWRGLMIDTSRHYLSVDTIKHAIDGMLYLKLNVLHWHIVD